jgi:subtilase family serine protease
MRLQADSGTVVAEINETNNNFRWDIDLTGEMDLSLENLSLLPRQPKSGDGVQFSLRVQNLGSLSSPATNLTLSINGFPVDRRAVGILSRGRSAEITLAWATAGLPAQNYTYELALDSLQGDVAPDNNRITQVLDLLPPPPAPDLRIARVDIEPRSPRVGENLSLGILVENQGNRDSGPCSLMVYFDSGLALLKFTDVPVLVPAITVGSNARVNVSRALTSFRPATYVLNITVDCKMEIAELNETNNRFTADLTLAEAEVRLPVLSVTNVTLEGTLRQGSAVIIVAVVSNQGEGDAQFVTVSFIIDGKVEWTVQIDQIKAGSEKTASFPWSPLAGKHGISVKAETLGANPAASPLRQETVAAPVSKIEGTDMTVPIIAGIAAVAAVAAVAGVLLMRRGKGPARE